MLTPVKETGPAGARLAARPAGEASDPRGHVRAVALALPGALERLPERYFANPDVRAILTLPPRGGLAT